MFISGTISIRGVAANKDFHIGNLRSQYHKNISCCSISYSKWSKFNEVQFSKCLSERCISICAVFWQTARFQISFKIFSCKCFVISKNFKTDKTITNRPATELFEIILSEKLFVIFFCNHKMGILDIHFLVKTISDLSKNNKFYLKLRSEKPCCAIWNIGSMIPKLDFYSVLP